MVTKKTPTYHEPWADLKPKLPSEIKVKNDTLTLRYSRIKSKAKAEEIRDMIRARPITKIVRIHPYRMAEGSINPNVVQYAIYAANK
jgi:hypothetical protein